MIWNYLLLAFILLGLIVIAICAYIVHIDDKDLYVCPKCHNDSTYNCELFGCPNDNL